MTRRGLLAGFFAALVPKPALSIDHWNWHFPPPDTIIESTFCIPDVSQALSDLSAKYLEPAMLAIAEKIDADSVGYFS